MRWLLLFLFACTPPLWTDDVHIVSVWPLDEATRRRFGVDLNGLWSPGVSVQGLAGEAELMAEHPELRAAVSRDVFGDEARVPWYDWLSEPVVGLSIASPVFTDYLVGRGRDAVDAGADRWFVDEIQTSALLLSREPHGAGFAPWEMQAFLTASGDPTWRDHMRRTYGATVPADWDAADLAREGDPAWRDRFFAAYRAFHEELAFRLMTQVIADVRAYAAARHRSLAIGANLAGLGARTQSSALNSLIWAGELDFLVFEHDAPSAAYYLLGRAAGPALVIAMPDLELARTVAWDPAWLRRAFAQAYAFEGSWGLGYWWEEMGWEPDALLPAELEPYTRFVRDHRALYEGPRARQPVAVVYPNGEVLADPSVHTEFLALCEELLERHVPFDVVYEGDDRFRRMTPDTSGYAAVLRPGKPVPSDLPAIEAPRGVLTALYDRGETTVLHLVNRRDPLGSFRVSLRGVARGRTLRWLVPGQPATCLPYVQTGPTLRFVVPSLDSYGVAVFAAPPCQTSP